MENSSIEDLLDDATDLFEQPGNTFEEGLNVDEPSMVQLRKACRVIDAAQFLQQHDGYYTIIIEASFAAMERTIQFYLLDTGLLHEDEYIDHDEVYQRGTKAGLYNQEFADKITGLWRNNRSETYYREGIATQERAQKMLQLAESVHRYVLQLAGERHKCICQEQ